MKPLRSAAIAAALLLLGVSGCLSGASPGLTALASVQLVTADHDNQDDVLWVRGTLAGPGVYGALSGPEDAWGVASFNGATGALTTSTVTLGGKVHSDLASEGSLNSTWLPVDLDSSLDSDRISQIAREQFDISSIDGGASINYWLYQTRAGPEWFVSLIHSSPENASIPSGIDRDHIVVDAKTGQLKPHSDVDSISFGMAVQEVLASEAVLSNVVEAQAIESDHWTYPTFGHAARYHKPPVFPDSDWGDGNATLWRLMLADDSGELIQFAFVRGDGSILLSSVTRWWDAASDGPSPYRGLDARDLRSPHEVLPGTIDPIYGKGLEYTLFWPEAGPEWHFIRMGVPWLEPHVEKAAAEP